MKKLSLENPIWVAILFLVALAVAVKLAPVIHAGTSPGQRPALVLEPKAKLQTEPGAWTLAPAVPSPIMRKEQRRLIVNWEIKETQAEIAAGVIYDDYWGFEGKVPGPLLRVREGDLIEVHLTNNIKSGRSHNIDFHFVSGPGGGASALNVAPGQTAVLEARAMAPGLYMFHCASPDIPSHIANGMYGFVLVEPAEGLPAVGREFYIVQSEIYAHNGEKGHQAFDIERGEHGDAQYVVFNGAVGSMLNDKAPHIGLNQVVRMYVGNAGPNFISSFHVIGQIFDNVYREGDLISPPAHGLQTTLVPAGGSTVVEFTPRVPGTFIVVDHAIFRMHRGAVASLLVDGNKELAAEIFNPITAAGQAEMSADAHMGRAMTDSTPQHEVAETKSQPVTTPTAQARQLPGDIPPASTPAAAVSPMTINTAAVSTTTLSAAGSQAHGNTIQILPGAGNYNAENTYGPKSLVVKKGTTVTWVNTDPAMVHNLADRRDHFSRSC